MEEKIGKVIVGHPKTLAGKESIQTQKIAEEKLKRSEEKYRFITENITDNITILDETYEWNEEARDWEKVSYRRELRTGAVGWYFYNLAVF